MAFAPGSGAEHEFLPPSADPAIRQELVETLYHVLWELVHVFFEHRGLLKGRDERVHHNAGASSFLYPFLDERESQLEPVLQDVARSVVMKSEEVGALRAQTLGENDAVLSRAGGALRECFAHGGQLLTLGNGGSATDAMDAVADFRGTGGGRWSARAAIDLTEDPGIITAIANDIGVEAIFLRQVIAYGRAGDALLALSTSGNSANVIAALDQARRRGLVTVAMVGYDGGRIAAEGLADHVVVTRSEHIPRIQEAQASAYHVLRELVG
jgi:D-sedoheptulose 7-phosphate isomerase